MTYSKKEINNILQLINSNNHIDMLLVAQLVKNRGLVAELLTDFYLLFLHLRKKKPKDKFEEIYKLFDDYLPLPENITAMPIFIEYHFKENNYRINQLALQFVEHYQLDYFKLSKGLYEINKSLFFYSTLRNLDLLRFIYRYSDIKIQRKIIPYFLKKEHNGCRTLDLGGMELDTLTEAILEMKNVHKIVLWGNNLKQLPDFFDAFDQLEILNLNNNKIKRLPASFSRLHKLQKLYANGNYFEAEPTIELLKQLEELKYISIGNINNEHNSSLYHFECLVNHGIIHKSPIHQKYYLALILNDEKIQQQLNNQELFDALVYKNKTFAIKAKQLLIQRSSKLSILKKGVHVAVVGHISYGMRQLLRQYKDQFNFNTDIQKETSIILIGENIEQRVDIKKTYIFLDEDTFKKVLQKVV